MPSLVIISIPCFRTVTIFLPFSPFYDPRCSRKQVLCHCIRFMQQFMSVFFSVTGKYIYRACPGPACHLYIVRMVSYNIGTFKVYVVISCCIQKKIRLRFTADTVFFFSVGTTISTLNNNAFIFKKFFKISAEHIILGLAEVSFPYSRLVRNNKEIKVPLQHSQCFECIWQNNQLFPGIKVPHVFIDGPVSI